MNNSALAVKCWTTCVPGSGNEIARAQKPPTSYPGSGNEIARAQKPPTSYPGSGNEIARAQKSPTSYPGSLLGVPPRGRIGV